MTLTSRMYATLDDFDAMKQLLRATKRAHPTTGLHAGELDWWVFYDTSGVPLADKVRLWFDDRQLVAWAWLKVRAASIDCFVHPSYRGTPEHEAVVRDALDDLRARVQVAGAPAPSVTVYVNEDEEAYIALLERLGFSASEEMVCFAQALSGDLPAPALPDGFYFLERVQPDDAERRALAHKDAFQPHSKMTPEHYRAFMGAPDYDPSLDIAVVAPDGTVVAFAMAWLDAENALGVFEPVGTRHAFHRRGLGKAALHEGMRRLQARGAQTVLVNCEAGNAGNRQFYQSAGFGVANRVLAFTHAGE